MSDTLNPPTRSASRHWFGLTPPETAVVAWGARAISAHNRLDLVWNRLQCDPTCREEDARLQTLHRELHGELDAYFLPLVKQRLEANDPALRGSSAAVTEIKSGRVTFRMSPNTSGGYLYLCAFIDQADLARTEGAAPCRTNAT
ncbi:MAG: hypothetical protein AB7P40_28965 [Chloroflexota bacterium]